MDNQIIIFNVLNRMKMMRKKVFKGHMVSAASPHGFSVREIRVFSVPAPRSPSLTGGICDVACGGGLQQGQISTQKCLDRQSYICILRSSQFTLVGQRGMQMEQDEMSRDCHVTVLSEI